MAGSSIRRSKRLRRNAPNGGGGLALGRWFGIPGYSVLGRGWCSGSCIRSGGWAWAVRRVGWVCHFTGDTDEGIQTDMLDNLPSDNFDSPPVVPPTRAQPDPMQDDSDSALGVEDVQLFPELKIRGSPKHLASPIKRFNACQKNAVRAIGLGDILDFQVEGIPKSMCRWLIKYIYITCYVYHTQFPSLILDMVITFFSQ
nr:beta-D-glucosyl crocetin beta-1,6-glucosyltransferase-like [Ipomoea batatas]